MTGVLMCACTMGSTIKFWRIVLMSLVYRVSLSGSRSGGWFLVGVG